MRCRLHLARLPSPHRGVRRQLALVRTPVSCNQLLLSSQRRRGSIPGSIIAVLSRTNSYAGTTCCLVSSRTEFRLCL